MPELLDGGAPPFDGGDGWLAAALDRSLGRMSGSASRRSASIVSTHTAHRNAHKRTRRAVLTEEALTHITRRSPYNAVLWGNLAATPKSL